MSSAQNSDIMKVLASEEERVILLQEIATFWRNDWSFFDGRTLRDQIWTALTGSLEDVRKEIKALKEE